MNMKLNNYFFVSPLIFCFSIFVLFSACQNNSADGVQTTKPAKSEKAESKKEKDVKVGNTTLSKYQHPLKIYSVLIPNKWKKEYIDKTQTIKMENGAEESIDIISIFGNVKIDASHNMKEVPLDFKNIAEEYLMDNIKNTLGFTVVENKNFTEVKQGEPGHLIFDYRTKEGIKRRRHTILRQDGNKGFYLHLNSNPDKFEEMDAVFRAMNDSFELLRGK